ncbi:MAG: sterol desaturase family protein [Pyrinomonadaceae bacterium]|nr:sterol desaturase family protein [Pyrinomonadaceae bacterium]
MGLEDYFHLYLSTVIWALLLPLVFYLPERLAPAEEGQPRAKRIVNLVYTPVAIAIIFLLQALFGPVYSLALTSSGGGLLSKFISEQRGLAGQLIFAVAFAVVWDIWQYWVHRLQHTNNFLWQTHKFHHTDTALNSTTQARHHALHNLPVLIGYLPIILLFGPQQPHFVAAFLMFRLWGFVNHANVRFNFGPLTPVVAGPQWHRIHHSIQTQHLNRNFATFFPFIDILFGTYYAPQKGEYPPTGSPEGQTGDLREATVAPLLAWNKMARLQVGKLRAMRRQRQGL